MPRGDGYNEEGEDNVPAWFLYSYLVLSLVGCVALAWGRYHGII